MSLVKDGLLYSDEHEWAMADGDLITIGITDHAQCALGDVVYVELPEIGKRLEKNKRFGVVESVKAVSDLFAPVSGEVVDVNIGLVDKPEVVNSDPYGEAWMIRVRVQNSGELDGLKSPEAYTEFLRQIAK